MGIPDYMLPQTVQRIRPSTSTDTYNNTTRNYAVPPATSTDVAGWLQQDSSGEPRVEGRDAAERGWLLITNESDIETADRIVFGSLTFEVDGPPAPAYTPAGYHHTETKLRLVTG